MEPATPQTRRWAILVSVFLVSFAVLAFEISLTRIFSVLFRYHYAFLAVSGAVCGLGIGGLGWHVIGRRGRRRPEAGWAALLFALLLPGAVILLFGTPLSGVLASRLWAAFIPLLPFALAGAFMAEVFRQQANESGRLYQADLAGAALAAVVIVPLIGATGALYLTFVLGGLAAIGAAMRALWVGDRRLLAASLAGAAVVFAAWPLAARGGLLQLRPLRTDNPEVAKPMLRDLADPHLGAQIIDSQWTAYARTDLVRYRVTAPDQLNLHIFTDGETPAPMIPFTGDLRKVRFLTRELPFLAFALPPHNRMLSIGPGGGMDFLMGGLAGFRTIDGVEINAAIARIMDRHRDINGNLYHRRRVHVTIDDGRSYVRRSRDRYDLIVSSLTQTATTGNVGLTLVESYIHTREAFADYYDHLTPDGRYALVTQSEPLALRAALTALQVMSDHGIKPREGCRHLLLLSVPNAASVTTPYRHLLVWKKSPLTAADLNPVGRAVAVGGVVPLFVPNLAGDPLLVHLARGETTLAQAYAEAPYEREAQLNLRPATDDRPFFLDLSFGVPAVLKGLLAGSLAAALLYTAALLWRRRGTRRRLAGWVLYFSALGVGFMLAEVPLMQKFILFLGHPTLSLAAIVCYLLIGASVGSRLSQNWPERELPRRVALASLVVVVLAVVYAFALSPLLARCLSWSLAARLALPAAFLLPLGIALGVPFPSGLRLMAAQARDDIPWMWGVNGLLSVVGSVLAAAGAKLAGFNGCLLAGAAIYGLVAVALAVRASRRSA